MGPAVGRLTLTLTLTLALTLTLTLALTLTKVDSAKWGAPEGSSNDMGEVRAQLKLAREQTLAVKLGAAEELTRLRGEAGAAERAVGKMQMEREIKDGLLAQQREQLGTLD